MTVPAELKILITAVSGALDELEASGYNDELLSQSEMSETVPYALFTYWDTVATAREIYRETVRFQFSGDEHTYTSDQISSILQRWILHTEIGLDRAMKISSSGDGDHGDSSVSPTYFSFEATDWELTGEVNGNGRPFATANAFNISTFPLFLEGPVRHMKTVRTKTTDGVMGGNAAMIQIVENVKNSGLYDESLNSYTVSASLKGQKYDMGRMMAFSPGWLENQSVWTHMSYKYYLEMLRGGLFEHFFEELVGGAMLPFMDQTTYGRSLLECSSFVASSAFPDENQQGRGFLARLSGSTAEFLSMWGLIFVGPNPFTYENDTISFSLVPALPSWMFSESGKISFKLFGEIEVTYHNEGGGDVFRQEPLKYEIETKEGEKTVVDGGTVGEALAIEIRKVEIKSIECWF